MKTYARELIGLLPEKLESIKIYPNTNLFDNKEMK